MTEWKVFERSTFYVKNGTLKGKEVGVGGGGGAVRKTRNRPAPPPPPPPTGKPGTGPEHPGTPSGHPGIPRNSPMTDWTPPEHP